MIDLSTSLSSCLSRTGIDDVITYDSGKLIKSVAPSASLSVCDDTCVVERVRVSVSLHSSVASRSCDRDARSLQTQRQLCGKTSI